MTVLGVDPGERRVGVAVADLETRFARPLEVIDASRQDAVERIVALALELEATVIVVGKPIGLSGREGPAVEKQQVLVNGLRAATEIEVTEFDERLTTVLAEAGLRAGGASRSKRNEMRDAVAAQVMLQGYLDSTR